MKVLEGIELKEQQVLENNIDNHQDCGMADGKEEPTIMFEDEAYSAQDLHHPRITENWRGPRDLQ
uniref:Uncharacterized protein n=1 Tax=Brassica oleracea var. oleracea TaxID=109376 RepID=A0A0D3CNZ7_BRAOL